MVKLQKHEHHDAEIVGLCVYLYEPRASYRKLSRRHLRPVAREDRDLAIAFDPAHLHSVSALREPSETRTVGRCAGVLDELPEERKLVTAVVVTVSPPAAGNCSLAMKG